jgi:hypothetical protein
MHDAITRLAKASDLVAREFDGPQCVAASALMVEIGARLGLPLVARPVSLFAFNYKSENSVATGDFGRAFGLNFLRRFGQVGEVGEFGEFEGGTPFQRHAGHMIVASEERSILVDPTFAQFWQLGDQAVPIFVEDISLHSSGRFWQVGDDDFFARYFVRDDFNEDQLAAVRRQYGPRADAIVRGL